MNEAQIMNLLIKRKYPRKFKDHNIPYEDNIAWVYCISDEYYCCIFCDQIITNDLFKLSLLGKQHALQHITEHNLTVFL